MTRQEFFDEYYCDCVESCTDKGREKCMADFYAALDSVIAEEKENECRKQDS